MRFSDKLGSLGGWRDEMPDVKVGCCGFPRGRKEYFSRLKLVEVQQTFYKPPQRETALRCREESIKALCFPTGLIHCVDPLERPTLYGKIGYFRLPRRTWGRATPRRSWKNCGKSSRGKAMSCSIT